jgi:hypothetical protein
VAATAAALQVFKWVMLLGSSTAWSMGSRFRKICSSTLDLAQILFDTVCFFWSCLTIAWDSSSSKLPNFLFWNEKWFYVETRSSWLSWFMSFDEFAARTEEEKMIQWVRRRRRGLWSWWASFLLHEKSWVAHAARRADARW